MRGFSLIELVVVLVILGLGAALVIPRVGSQQTGLLKAEAREASALLNHARRRALIQGSEVSVDFHPAANPERAPGSASPRRDARTWVSRGAQVQWRPVASPGGVDSSPTGAAARVTFYPGGGASGGSLVLTRDALSAVLSVDALTGKVELSLGEAGS